MKNVPMRFDGYTFRHNPSKLTIEDAAAVAAILPPFDAPDSVRMGRRLRLVRGEGELYGADCLEQYRGLRALCEQGHRGLLSLPHLPPMTAYLRELSMSAEPREDILSFRFSFIEARGESSPVDSADVYIVAEQGESLWDIAYANGKGIDELAALNPQIRFIECLNIGEKVRLC